MKFNNKTTHLNQKIFRTIVQYKFHIRNMYHYCTIKAINYNI